MKDLLKDAIADAKAVRETALANAKLALEEAFTPRIQSMLSAKLSEELEDDDMYEGEEEEVDVEVAPEPTQEVPAEPAPEAAPAPAPEAAPAPAPEEDEMTEEDDDLDLEEIIRELEGSEDEVDATMAEEEMNDEEMTEEEDMDIDINEIIRALKEEDEESEKEEMTEEEMRHYAKRISIENHIATFAAGAVQYKAIRNRSSRLQSHFENEICLAYAMIICNKCK